jgi:hypothetical protein
MLPVVKMHGRDGDRVTRQAELKLVARQPPARKGLPRIVISKAEGRAESQLVGGDDTVVSREEKRTYTVYWMSREISTIYVAAFPLAFKIRFSVLREC